MSSILDQGDETEVLCLNPSRVRELFDQHILVTGGEPLAEAEPTPEQLAALHDKVVVRGEEPYADFAILTPFGRRVQRGLKLRSWLLQPDGSYAAHDVPGPPTYEAWLACFKVYKAALLCLTY